MTEEKAESIAFQAGAKAAQAKVPLKDSALRMLHPNSRQYSDFVDGYDSVKRKTKKKEKPNA